MGSVIKILPVVGVVVLLLLLLFLKYRRHIMLQVRYGKETYLYGKRDLLIWQKRPTYMAKETYLYGKETYLYGKRDLLIWQKRPTYMAKETYLYGERDLFIWR